MEYRGRSDADDRFEQFSRNLMRWVLGPGLLSVHVGVYLVTLVSLLLWNFARTPSDVWVDGPLRSWGLVVVFHATAVAAGWAAWRLMRMGQAAIAPEAPPARTASLRAQPVLTSHLDTHRASPSANGTTEEWARRWLRESVRVVRDAVGPSADGNGRQGDGHLARPAPSGVAGPGITEWGTLFARRTRQMMATARDHLSPGHGASNGAGATAPTAGVIEAPPDPARTWPVPTNGAAYVGDAQDVPVHANGVGLPEPLDFTHVTTADGHAGRNGATDGADAAVSEEARWTWVEAAAAAWIARREMDDLPVDPEEAPPPPTDEPTAAP